MKPEKARKFLAVARSIAALSKDHEGRTRELFNETGVEDIVIDEIE